MFGEKLAECLIDQFADGDISAEAGGFGCRQNFELVVIASHHPSPELCARRFGGGAGALSGRAEYEMRRRGVWDRFPWFGPIVTVCYKFSLLVDGQ